MYGLTPLHVAVIVHNDMLIHAFLFRKRVDVNEKTLIEGDTPLILAAKGYRSTLDRDFYEMLLGFGGDPNIKNKAGFSANDFIGEYTSPDSYWATLGDRGTIHMAYY